MTNDQQQQERTTHAKPLMAVKLLLFAAAIKIFLLPLMKLVGNTSE